MLVFGHNFVKEFLKFRNAEFQSSSYVNVRSYMPKILEGLALEGEKGRRDTRSSSFVYRRVRGGHCSVSRLETFKTNVE